MPESQEILSLGNMEGVKQTIRGSTNDILHAPNPKTVHGCRIPKPKYDLGLGPSTVFGFTAGYPMLTPFIPFSRTAILAAELPETRITLRDALREVLKYNLEQARLNLLPYFSQSLPTKQLQFMLFLCGRFYTDISLLYSNFHKGR